MKPLLLALAPLALAALPLLQEGQDAPVMPEVGNPAPTFRLNDHTGRAVTIGEESEDGRWTVMAFFPKAATPG